MALVSSNTSLLSLLLLFLMLLHQGLQTPVPPSVSASGKASKLNCNIIVKEILSSIKVSNLDEGDDITPLRNETLRRANLCEFLRMGNVSKIDKIETKLKILGRCLPKGESTSQMTNIFLTNNEKDFNEKLRYFVSQMEGQLPTQIPTTPDPTSDPVTSCSVTME